MWKLSKTKQYINITRAWRFFKRFKVHPLEFFLPAMLSLAASVFDGLSLACLIPTIKGMLERDFNFVNNYPLAVRTLSIFYKVFGERQATILGVLIVAIVGSVIMKEIFAYSSSMAATSVVVRFKHNLRTQLYNRYLTFGKAFFDQNPTAHLYQILLNFTEEVAVKLLVLNNTLRSFFTLAVYLVIMSRISWQLTVFTIIMFPLLQIPALFIIGKIKRTSTDLAASTLRLSKKIANALSCIPLVKTNKMEEKESGWFAHASQRVNKFHFSIVKKQALLPHIHEFTTICAMISLVALMTFLLVKKGAGTIEGYLVFFFLLRRSAGSFNAFNRALTALATIKGPISEIAKVFNSKDKFIIPEGTKEFAGTKQEISLVNLSYSYPNGTKVLNNVNLKIKKGQTTAIVGKTGAGKTTLLSLLMRFYEAPPNTIFIDSNNIESFTLKSLRTRMGLISQETFLFNASLRFNIQYGVENNISEEELIDVLKKSRLYNFVSSLPKGLETEVGDRGVMLSGGEKQRVAICRAILKKADIILLDEATSSLDSITEKLVQEAIEEITKDNTAIVIAHRLSTIKHADKIVVMEQGKITEKGTLQNLLDKKGMFYLYWSAQSF